MAPPFNISVPTVDAFSHWALSQRDLQRQILRKYGVYSTASSDEDDVSLDSMPSLGGGGETDSDDDSSVDTNTSFNQFANRILFRGDTDGGGSGDITGLWGDEESCNGDDGYGSDDEFEFEPAVGRRERSPNMFGYEIGDFMKSCYYTKFLHPDVRQRTYIQSRIKDSQFRSHFRVTLNTIDSLTDLFIERGWVTETKRVKGDEFYVRTQLLIMSALEHLGGRKPFRQFPTSTNMSPGTHSDFFNVFLDRFYDCREEWVRYPDTMLEMKNVMSAYEKHYLPGCGGSIDVVHCKWAACAAGDNVKAKGKEGYPTLAFECITNNTRKILGVSSVQFGSRNDQHIVRLDDTVRKLRTEWYTEVEWSYFDLDGNELQSTGVYLICDGGYLRWRTLICPYQHAHKASRHGYFSSNLESVRKDVECTFGILKKRWRILDFGLHYRSIAKNEKIFMACCILHNMIIDSIDVNEINSSRIGRGAPLPGDSMYLEGPSNRDEREICSRHLRRMEQAEAAEWVERRDALSQHIYYCKH